jgi:hypothetical protein
VGLVEIVRFLVVELIHPSSNLRFDMIVTYLRLIILSVICDVSIDSEVLFDRLCESQDQVNPVFQMCS